MSLFYFKRKGDKMSEVNLNLKFQVNNAKSVNDIADKIDALEVKTRKKFKLEIDTENFNTNLNTLQSTLNRLGKDTGLIANMKNIASAFGALNNVKLDSVKIREFVDSIKAINVSEMKQIAGSLNSLGNAITKLSGNKLPSMSTFVNSIKKLAESSVDLKKIENILLTLEHFKSITFDIKGLSEFKDVIKALNGLNKLGVDDAVLGKLKKIVDILNGIKIDINMSGLSSIPTMIKNMEGLDKIKINEADFLKKMQTIQKGLAILSNSNLDASKSKAIGDMLKGFSGLKGLESLERIKLDEQKFLKKMQTIRKGFEELSKAQIDVNKMKQMADAMRSIVEISSGSGGAGGNGGSSSLSTMVAGFMSMQAIGNSLEQAKELEYSILQIGVAGELTSQQMKDVKNSIYELSNQSGKSAIEVSGALDTIIKTGQALASAQLILDAAVKTSVSSGEPLIATANSLSKILLAMNINASEAMTVTDMMQSVMNKTPASMSSMQEGLKQSVAGLANYANSTVRTGVALDEYKNKLVQTGLAMQGSQAMLGRQGECLPFSI